MSFGIKVENSRGETVIDADYLNYALYTTGSVTVRHGEFTTVTYPQALTGIAAPIIAIRRWDNSRFFITFVLPLGSPGAWTGFRIRGVDADVHTAGSNSQPSLTVAYQVYAVDLPSVETWGMQVFNGAGERVFDSGRKLLTFRTQILGIPALWQLTEGTPIASYRTFLFDYIGGVAVASDEYVAIGLFQSGAYGVNNVTFPNGRQVTSQLGCFQGVGFTSNGTPRYFLDVQDVNGYIVAGVAFYAFSPLPVIN